MGFRWLNRYHPFVSIMQEAEKSFLYCSKNFCAVFKSYCLPEVDLISMFVLRFLLIYLRAEDWDIVIQGE